VWSGLDVDLCRAVAAAVYQRDATNVKYVPLNAEDRIKVLQSGAIDLLSRISTGRCRARPSST